MKNNEFTGYLENLLQEARTLNPLEGEPGKAWFQGAMMGISGLRQRAYLYG